MRQPEIERLIFRRLYEAFFQGQVGTSMEAIREEGGWEEIVFWKVAHYLTEQGLIKAWTAGANFKIESIGIIHAEDNDLAPKEIIEKNQNARTIILDFLARFYEEAESSFADVHIQTLSDETGLDIGLVANNLRVLEDLGYVESVTIGGSKITYHGLEAVEEWRQRSELADEYEEITKMSPQPRGRALQKLFAKVVENDGWSQEEGTRTSHEEMDVIIYREREYYLIECKWEKDAIEARIVRELHGKLSNRVGVQGMIVSMSGFTSGAVEQAADYASSRIIIFFGPEDVRSLVYGKSTLDSLLNSKYQQLITRRKVVFE